MGRKRHHSPLQTQRHQRAGHEKKGGNDSTAIIATQYLSILFLLNRKRSGHHAL
ncbi:hypothetical protein HMPREF1146_2443 [Prevotella sp. MSX73]|nr:hypothetical protein HMPREF1146_2443 [Prevotella sp. MSX73]